MIGKLLLLLLIFPCTIKAQEILHPTNVVRYADFVNISIQRKAGTDSIFIYWCGGGNKFLYRDLSVQIADTPAMLLPYVRKNVADALYATLGQNNSKLNIADTNAMLGVYLRKFDTTVMLAPYLNSNNAASLYATIAQNNLKLNFADTLAMLGVYLRKFDTTAMLLPYLRGNIAATLYATIAQNNSKVNISDTLAMLGVYLRKFDTTAMLLPYMRKSNNLSDLTNAATARTNLILGNVDNTNDLSKPVSTAQNAINITKADINSPAFTGNPTAPNQAFNDNSTRIVNTAFVQALQAYARVTGGNVTTTGQALVDITGLSIALLANGVYHFEAVLSVSTSAVTTGTQYGVNFSAAGATFEAHITGSLTSTAAKTERMSVLNTATTAFLTTSAQTGGINIKGIIVVGANAGNLTIKHLKVTSGTSTVFPNSFVTTKRIQ